MNLTDDDVTEILKLLYQSPYDELQLETDRFKLTLRRGGQPSWLHKRAAAQEHAQEEIPAAAPATSAEPQPAPRANGAIRDIRPPMPGTFYRAPAPGAEPFIEVGRTVVEDTILGLVETMKLMNSVMADCRGEVIEICAQNGTAVDVGDTLVRIRVADNG